MQEFEKRLKELEEENRRLQQELAHFRLNSESKADHILSKSQFRREQGTDPHTDKRAGSIKDEIKPDKAEQLMLRCVNIFQALALSTDILIPSEDIGAGLQTALKFLGGAAEVSRVYLFNSSRSIEGKIILHYYLEWCNDSIQAFIDDPDLQNFPLEEYNSEVVRSLLNNDVYIVHTFELHDDVLQQTLEKQNILSMVHVPIFVNQEFWGIIGFDECIQQRQWSEPEVAALQFAAKSLGIVLELRLITDKLDKSRKIAEDRAKQLKHAQSIAHLGSWQYNLADRRLTWSDDIYSILGCSSEQLKPSIKTFLSLLHPQERHDIITSMKKSMQDAKSYEAYFRIFNYNGELKYIYGRSVTDLDENHEAIGLSGIIQDLTPLRTIEQALRESESRYRELINTLPAVVYYGELDDQSSIIISPQCKTLLGYDPEYMIANIEKRSLFVHPEDLSRIRSTTMEAIQSTAHSWSSQYRMITADKDIKWIQDTMHMARDESGRVTHILGVMLDITERKQVEAELESSELRFRSIFENAPLGIALINPDYKLLLVNNTFEIITGYLRHELTEISLKELIHPEDFATCRYLYDELFKGNRKSFTLETRYISKAGRQLWVSVTVTRIDDINYNDLLAVAMVENITLKKQAESEILQQKNLLENLLGNMPVGISAKDPQNSLTYTFFNNSLEKMFNAGKDQVLGKTDYELFEPQLAKRIEQEDKQVIEQGQIFRVAGKQLRDHGVDIITDYIKIPVYDQAGTPTMLLTVFEDVTDKIKLEEQLRQAEKMQVIGQLAGGIAHDFNNQLMGILGYADLLQNKTSDPLLTKYARMIGSAARHSADLTQQLLTFARKSQLILTCVDIHSLITDTVSMLEHTLDRRIHIEVDLQADNPVVNGDPGQLQNALLNLCLNSRDAMPRGGIIEIRTGLCALRKSDTSKILPQLEPGKYIKLIIKDSGSGMDQKTKSRMFEPFFTTKETGKGTGMGLPTVFGTITSHKGGINVESSPGKGTTFTIYLPVSSAYYPDQLSSTQTEQLQTAGRILLIDDDLVVRELLTELLKEHGYEVEAFTDGNSAVAYYEKYPDQCDLVILDMIMPTINGSEVFGELKNIQPNVKVLLISGYSYQIEQLLNLGAIDYIPKPVTANILLDKISQVLRS